MLNLHDSVTIITKEGGLVSGIIRGRLFMKPMRYDVMTEKGMVKDVLESQLTKEGSNG